MWGTIGRVINWYLKDGIGPLIGKLIGTVVTAVSESYLGWGEDIEDETNQGGNN